MAEARSEEEEENMMRDTREQVVRRQPNSSGGRPDRRKPEHRHSQGPLSSIRAAIKRTSNRSTSLSESSRDRERDRERDRDRRRPEITILSAEPLASTSWFPGASGGFPPPPPPAAQIWGPTIPPSIQPPPSYEEVIREKTQEQVLLPSSSSSLPSSSSRPVSSITIATQTDSGSAPDHQDSQARRPVRPPRPRLPTLLKSSSVDEVAPTPNTPPPCCDLLTELCSPLTANSRAQTDQWDQSFAALDVAAPPTTSSQVPSERPKPRPRTRLSAPPISNEVKVQTLVKLREDGFATIAARAGANSANQEVSQGKYLQELLEAFSADDWGFPERQSSSSGNSQSESEEGDEEEEDMATLRARIQAFEQQQQQVADGSCGEANKDFITKKPEPRPRPRLQPTKSAPPTVAPKPKNFSQASKPSTKVFWEDPSSASDSCSIESPKPAETPPQDSDPEPVAATEPAPTTTPKPALTLGPQPYKPPEKPLITPKPQAVTETLQSGTPVPTPRPPPPKLTPSDQQTKPPPRPPVAPRASLGGPSQEKSTTAGQTTPTLPPRPSVEVSSGAATETKSEETPEVTNQAAKPGGNRPGIPTKPAGLTSLRRSSAPNLAPKPTGASPTPSESNPAPPKPIAPTTAPKPQGPTPGPAPSMKPLTTAPSPALRKGPVIQNKPETANTVTPDSSDPPLPPRPTGVKLLPLRPPPIKSIPGRPPPPSITSPPASTQITAPTPQTAPTPLVSQASRSSPPPQSPSSVSANQIQSQKLSKRGPPLPPRPKPGHPLYNSCTKQEVLIVLDDPTPAELPLGEGRSQTSIINQTQCLLDLDVQPDPPLDQDSQSKPALEDLSLSDSQSIIPVQPTEQKEQPDPPPVSGPRCVALFDYEGEEEDELTFSQGDVIALLELIGQEWGRGQIHGRVGIFPLSFTEVVEPLKQEETTKLTTETPVMEKRAPVTSQKSDPEVKEWAVALFDFPGQTAEDLSFHKGALIEVMGHVDAEWRRGRLEGREGLYPAAFTQSCQAQPITAQQSSLKGVAKFDFTAESEDELTVKVGDMVTQVETVDEQWILGVAGGKRGIVPKNYISLL
ncbi:SH3 domain-containing protein 19-like isoform X1 [Xyrichtys novacula]|uniref:SH3 domain-containing protein 19-like isoform X1 n=1 Tax=Xyrichtys novacula TaxID=13765 RepID=A0AAV1HJG3_XYRNO|nr:SH3 domain-containing protein 19-like isoform X1 [Xyrichtys novacula]